MCRRFPFVIIGLYVPMTVAVHAEDFTPSVTNLSDDIVDEVNSDGAFTQDETRFCRNKRVW